MKVVFPKHIQKGLLAGMSFSIGPLTLSIIQLFLVAIGVAAGLGVFNAVSKSGSKAMGVIVALPVIGAFLAVAFFKVSELSLLPFVTKIVRNNFFDVPKKFQTNYERFDKIDLLIKRSKTKEAKKSVERKEYKPDEEFVNNLNEAGLL